MRIGFTTDAEVEVLDWAKQHGFGAIAWMRFDQSFAAPGKEHWRAAAERFGAEARARDISLSTIGAFYRNPLDPRQTEFARAALHRAIDVAELLGVRNVSGFPGGVIETTINPRGGQPAVTPLEDFIPHIVGVWSPVANHRAGHGGDDGRGGAVHGQGGLQMGGLVDKGAFSAMQESFRAHADS